MCIAIYKPSGFLLTDETIAESWRCNADGAGFMYNENNKLHIVKGLMTLEAFKEAYKPHEEKNCVLHFRIKTHGNKDQENTHPFAIDDRLGMVHNGILTSVDTKEDQTKSDTWHFTKKHLFTFRKNNHNFYTNPIYKEMIESFIGFSKLIFMDNKGKVSIFNESKGDWDSGCWFSNKSYQPYQQQTPNYSKKQKNNWKNQNPQQNVTYLPAPQNDTTYGKDQHCPVPNYTAPKKSDANPKTGDVCKTKVTVVGKTVAGLEGTIPLGSYVKILYFTTANWIGIEEVLTGIKAELHGTFLDLIPRVSLGEQSDFENISL
jgi:predicted glutamine amidotransferase